MDDKRFDALAKALGSGGSRRSLLRVAVGAALGGTLGGRGRPATAADKVFVCHKGKTQEIAASALPAHLGHGDTEGPCCLQATVCGPGQSLTVSPNGVCTCGCPAGTTDCAGQCRDLATDPANCGACGAVCAPANATGGCVVGACVVGACAAGFADCNGAPGDGCETDLLADPANCGTCGTACSAPVGGWALCEAGGCVSGCDDGFTDCAGVCVDLTSDPDHCGGCPNACGAPACSTATCENAGCVYAPIDGCCDEDADCDDGNSCTVDTCDLETNTCDHAFADAGTECDDDTVCNGRETCDGAGACRPGEPLDCDDANPCTDDSCDPVEGCAHEPAEDGTACGEDRVCTDGACECAEGFSPLPDGACRVVHPQCDASGCFGASCGGDNVWCLCTSSVEGVGFCLDAFKAHCNAYAPCLSSADCPDGLCLAVGNCCGGVNLCVPSSAACP